MPNRIGFGKGFGFRGYSPVWPYVGRGRGGLPRCMASGFAYNPSARLRDTTYGNEMAFLKIQAENLKQNLEVIESRIENLERQKEGAA